MNLWPNQHRALVEIAAAIQSGVKRMCITSPTGSGKTTMMFDQLRLASEESLRSCLYTHRRMLFDQTATNMGRAGIRFGKRASGHSKLLMEPVQICMTQSELSAVYKTKKRDLHDAHRVLIDELHVQTGETMQRIIADHVAAGAVTIGFSATPLDIGDVADKLLVVGTPSECRQFGALVPAETFAPDEPDLRHIKNYRIGDDLTEKQNQQAMMRPGVFGRVLSAWQQHNPEGKPTLLFAPDVKGSIYFAEQFSAAGIPAAHIDGDDIWLDGQTYASDHEMRELVQDRLERGDLKVVTNRFVLREGIDWPFVECGIFACVFGSLTSYIQSGGRLLRASPSTGKTKAICIDHGGNWWRHGSLNADREWKLGMTNYQTVGQRMEDLRPADANTPPKEAQPITCPQCHKVRASGPECSECGFRAPKRSRMVVQVDGALREVEGSIVKPRFIKMKSDTQQLWERMYFRMRRAGKTFRQAEGLFVHENHYWPPRDMKLMPVDPADWWRKIDAVKPEALQ